MSVGGPTGRATLYGMQTPFLARRFAGGLPVQGMDGPSPGSLDLPGRGATFGRLHARAGPSPSSPFREPP